MSDFELEADLAAANPVPEMPAAAVLPADINDMVIRQITESTPERSPLRGINLARAGFLGVLASVGLVLLGLHLLPGTEVTEVTPAISATPVEEPVTTAEVLTVGPNTTLAQPLRPVQTTTSTTQPPTTTASEPAATSVPQDAPPVPDTDEPTDPIDEPDQETEPCTATGATQKKAVAAYQDVCSVPRVDCDPVEDYWLCSSEQIGESKP